MPQLDYTIPTYRITASSRLTLETHPSNGAVEQGSEESFPANDPPAY